MLNWLSRFRLRSIEEKSGLSAPGAALAALFGLQPSAAGVSVTPATAMQVPAVNAAVRAIAETVGELPAKVRRRLEGGGKADAADHPAYALVHDDACEWQSAGQFRTHLTTDALLHGDGFAFVNRIEGRAIELNRLDPTQVRIRIDEVTREPRYDVAAQGRTRTYGPSDVLHIPCHSIDGIRGLSPIAAGRETIGEAIILAKHSAQLFRNGGRPSGILKHPGALSEQAKRNLKASWNASHAGEASGGTAVLEEGIDFTLLTFSSVDAQFLELRQNAVVEIARLFRVPPVLIMDYGRATWSNAAEMGAQFLTYTLLPWLRTWEAAYRRVLLSEEERRAFAIEFIVDDLLRADIATRATAYSQLIASKVLNPNEVRALESRPPYEGGDLFVNPHTTSGAS